MTLYLWEIYLILERRGSQVQLRLSSALGKSLVWPPLLSRSLNRILRLFLISKRCLQFNWFIGWFKRSLKQSRGSFSCNPHFALFQPDWRWDIFRNASDHWGMVTYNFFRNFFFRSLIRASTGSFANVCQALCPISIKLGQILCCKKIGHRP